MTGIVALYIFMLAAFTGYEVISRVPVILHTPLMSGSNFVHGIVLVGAMVALGAATTPLERVIGFIGVVLAAGNAVGGYVVTERMLEMFKSSGTRKPGRAGPRPVATDGRLQHGSADPGELSRHCRSLHPRPEANELAGHGEERHLVGRRGHARRHAHHVPHAEIDPTNYWLILAAIAVGGVLAWWSGKRVAMTDMPQMIALYNGMAAAPLRHCRCRALQARPSRQ